MLKKITVFLLTITLFAGLYFSPTQANSNDKLNRILQVTGLPTERHGLEARLDRDLLVYGLPSDIPNNQWKPAPTSWEKENNRSIGFSGNQEPRYLGKTVDWSDFANDYFPDDAEYHISPARRNIIRKPWDFNYETGENEGFSDYSWGLIKKALSTYNQRIGFNDNKDGFANNPAFYSDFDNVKKYFKVLAEPRPGMAGAVRHWHKRADLGGVWYDPIFIRWDILPNFIVESIDPGTDKAQPGQTYTGRVVLKAKPDGSFTSDPVTNQLFNAMGLKLELPQDYVVPFGVVVNGQLVPIKNFQPVSGLENIYQYKVPAGTKENILEFAFEWTVPATHSDSKIIVATGVNESIDVLPKDVWGYMDWSEITNVDNAKAVEVPVELGLPDLKIEIFPNGSIFKSFNGDKTAVMNTVRITRKDNIPGDVDATGFINGPAGYVPINFKMKLGHRSVEGPYDFPAGPGSYAIEAEIWPVGKKDAYDKDNRYVVTVTVANETIIFDSKIRSDLIDGGPVYTQ